MKPFINSYGLNDKVFKVMVNEAVEKDYDSLLDIFKEKNNPAASKTYKTLLNQISEGNLCDLVLDLNTLSDIDDTAKRFEVMYEMYSDVQDMTIAAEIKNNFGIKDKLDNIAEYVKKLDDGKVSSMQVAFEIADKYNLPAGAEKEILEIIGELN